MTSYRIIVNPTAGKGAGQKAIPEIEALLQRQGLSYDLICTTGPWHAADLAEEAAQDGVDIVVAVGGDGTVNEVLNGLMRIPQDRRSAALGVLCVGRGNDFAFGAGIPTDLAAGVQTLADGHRRTIDVGHVVGGDYPEGRYFGNGIGIGFDAVVGFIAAEMKHISGFLGYIVATVRTVFRYYPAPTVSLTWSNGMPGHREATVLPALMVSVMNGRRMGGGFMMAPEGQTADGLLDLCIARQVSRLGVFGMVPHFMRGTQATQAAITTARASRLTVSVANGDTLPAHADGETLCTAGRRLDVTILPKQVAVLCSRPADAPTPEA